MLKNFIAKTLYILFFILGSYTSFAQETSQDYADREDYRQSYEDPSSSKTLKGDEGGSLQEPSSNSTPPIANSPGGGGTGDIGADDETAQPAAVPFDGGVSLLVAAAIGFSAKKARQNRKKKQAKQEETSVDK